MRIATNLLYCLVASLLLFSLSIAVQRTFFSQAPTAGEDRLQPTSRAASRPGLRVAAASYDEEDESIDPAAADSDRPAVKRGLAPRRNAGAAPDLTEVASSHTSARDVAAAPPDRAWSNLLAALPSLFSSGSGGAAGGVPATVASSTTGASSPASPQSNPAQVREVFFADRKETACQPGGQQFVLDDLRGLYVCVIWSGLAGTYWEQLTFMSPDGNVYQKMTLAFVTPGAQATAATVEVEGRQIEVQQAGWGRPGETAVVATLPVAGTYITQHNLDGSWTVKISLNGRPIDQGQFVLQAQP